MSSNVINIKRPKAATLQEKLAQRIALNSRRAKIDSIKAVTAQAVADWRERQEVKQ